jgi:hypothetical protein
MLAERIISSSVPRNERKGLSEWGPEAEFEHKFRR